MSTESVAAGRRVEIAGAGLSGLMTAAVLARRGWQVRVHERSGELRDIGAGIYIWSNGLRALKEIGAYDQATARAERITRNELLDERGLVLQREWLLQDHDPSALYTILRDDLHNALADAARAAGAEILVGSEVVAARPDGTLLLSDGDSVRADLLVGADGIRSAVRDSLGLVQSMVPLGDGCSRHLVDRRENDRVGLTQEQWNGGRRIGVVPCSPDRIYIFLCCPERDLEGRRDPIDHSVWSRAFPNQAELIERITADASWWPFHDVTCRSWSSGHAALIGDAAHAMSPNLGQSICMAMSNAVALGQALDLEADIPAALRLWEASERPLTDVVQRNSRIYGRIGTQWPSTGGLLRVRSGLLRALGHSKGFQRRVSPAAIHRPDVAAARA